MSSSSMQQGSVLCCGLFAHLVGVRMLARRFCVLEVAASFADEVPNTSVYIRPLIQITSLDFDRIVVLNLATGVTKVEPWKPAIAPNMHDCPTYSHNPAAIDSTNDLCSACHHVCMLCCFVVFRDPYGGGRTICCGLLRRMCGRWNRQMNTYRRGRCHRAAGASQKQPRNCFVWLCWSQCVVN